MELCGTTVIEGAESGVLPVRLSRDAVIKATPDEDIYGPGQPISVSGDGRFIGFALVEDRPKRDGAGLFGGRVLPDEPGEQNLFTPMGGITFSPEVDGYLFPAGDYLLYLVADGSPVTIAFEFSGLSGDVTAGIARPVDAALRELRPSTELPSQNYYEASTEHTLVAPGIAFRALNVTGGAHAAGAYTTCIQRGGFQSTPVGTAPLCSDSRFRELAPTGPALGVSHRVNVSGVTFFLDAGRYGQGASYAAASMPTEANFVAGFLSLQ